MKKILNILLGVGICLVLIYVFLTTVGTRLKRDSLTRECRLKCKENLAYLHTLLLDYANNNEGRLPSNNWCDIFKEEKKEFPVFCPGSGYYGIDQCSYALNDNVTGKEISSLPDNIVLLFESDIGWNQTGIYEQINWSYHTDWSNQTDKNGIAHVILLDGTIIKLYQEEQNNLIWQP